MALPMVYGGPGRYVQGPGELSRQGGYLSWLGCAAYVLFDQGTEDRLCRQSVDGVLDEDLSEPCFKIYNGPCTEDAVVEMAKEARAEYCDMVVGIGGGAGWYFKIYRPKKQQAAESEADYGGEYDGAEDYDETDSEDDGPPWDEDGEE